MADETQSVTVEILRAIRDELSRLRGDVGALRVDTNARFDELRGDTNARLDFLADGQLRLATEVAGLRGEVHELRGGLHDLRGVVERNGERFEHFLATEGDIIRDLKTRMTRVEHHLGLGD